MKYKKISRAKSLIILLPFLLLVTSPIAGARSFGILELTDGTTLIGFLSQENDSQVSIQDLRLGDKVIESRKIAKRRQLEIGTSYLIRTIDGRSISGKIGTVEANLIEVENESLGRIALNPDSIIDFRQNQKAHFPNPNATRYFFAPSSFMLAKGEGYYQNTYILMNSVNYGLTRNITAAGGVILPFWFYVTPKIGFQISEHYGVACGGFYATSIITEREMDMGVGIGYLMMTAGGRENNITLACGYGYSRLEREWNKTKYPIVMLGGMKRITPRFSLVSENWAVSSKFLQERVIGYGTDDLGAVYPITDMLWNGTYKYNGIASAGLRWMTEKISFDLAFVIPINVTENFLILPYLDFVYKF